MAKKRAKGGSVASDGTKLIASNKRARRDYDVLDTFEAGIVLQGSEVKSLREGNVQLADAYARITKGEAYLEGVNISPYLFATGFGAHVPDRPRKLLLHRDELDRLDLRIAQDRLTLVPLRLYFSNGKAKVELALAKGRTKGDKRQTIAQRDAQREIEHEVGRRIKHMD